MRGLLRWVLESLPGVRVLVRRRRSRIARERFGATLPPDTTPGGVFTSHYSTNHWRNDESVSGLGSTLSSTEKVRAALPELARRFGVRTLLDAPCGDFNWMRHVRWPEGTRYLGGDIVAPLVERNLHEYAAPGVDFLRLDITADDLPHADLWLCRDCFQHLSEEAIHQALANFVRSGVGYLLTTNFPDCRVNSDIVTGDYRQFNLLRPPFSLPAPLTAINDPTKCEQRELALWRRETLADALRKNTAHQRAVSPTPPA